MAGSRLIPRMEVGNSSVFRGIGGSMKARKHSTLRVSEILSQTGDRGHGKNAGSGGEHPAGGTGEHSHQPRRAGVGQGGRPQSGFFGERPRRQVDDRRRRSPWRIAPRDADHRANQRKHRDRPGPDRQPQGIPHRAGDAGKFHCRTRGHHGSLRRQGDAHPGGPRNGGGRSTMPAPKWPRAEY
jgi:hypothetical protein